LAALLALPQVKKLLSSDHFSIDGTLIDAWASMNSFRPKDGSGDPPAPGRNGERNFRKEKRSNKTHASTTDPDARLYRKGDGQPSRLCFMGHVLMENRNGLAVQAMLNHATGTAEREAALVMIDRHKRSHRITLAADKAYDVTAFVGDLRERKVMVSCRRLGAGVRYADRRPRQPISHDRQHPRPRPPAGSDRKRGWRCQISKS